MFYATVKAKYGFVITSNFRLISNSSTTDTIVCLCSHFACTPCPMPFNTTRYRLQWNTLHLTSNYRCNCANGQHTCKCPSQCRNYHGKSAETIKVVQTDGSSEQQWLTCSRWCTRSEAADQHHHHSHHSSPPDPDIATSGNKPQWIMLSFIKR